MAIDRVKKRVTEGGHNIAVDVIRRRYAGGIKNLFDIYISVADEVMIFDNTNGVPELIAEKAGNSDLEISDNVKFEKLKNSHERI